MYQRLKLPAIILTTLLAATPILAASSDLLTQLNSTIKELLVEFNVDSKLASLVFNQIEMNAERVNNFDVNLNYSTTGSKNYFNVNSNVNYGTATTYPTLNLKINVGSDFIKLVGGQEEFNKTGPEIDAFVKSFLEDYSKQKEYGDALKVNAAVTDMSKDRKGDLQLVKFIISVDLDLNKLPANKEVTLEELKSLELEATITRNKMDANLEIKMNPKYIGFEKDQMGLKEVLEKLLAKDPETLSQIKELVKFLDSYAQRITEQESN